RQNKLQKIFNLLQEISDHRKINVKILAQQVNCTEEEILQALNYFIPELDLDPTENINNDIIFETNTLGEKQDCCPYCLNSVPKNDKQCLSCGKRIIRCELCGKIIDPQKNKHAITSETITIRNAQSITQKVIKNYLCEKCMLRTRYNLV
ncbi:MAG: hypothetical protein U9O98_00710, partial [Asgard group archaeon]|nr:hypothetical protein [Asgard group archaeon]